MAERELKGEDRGMGAAQVTAQEVDRGVEAVRHGGGVF